MGIPYNNRISPWLTEFGPPIWQAEADTEVTLSALPAEAVGQNSVNYGEILLLHAIPIVVHF